MLWSLILIELALKCSVLSMKSVKSDECHSMDINSAAFKTVICG